MLPVSQLFKYAMVSPIRTFKAETDVHINASDVSEVTTFTHEDAIKTVEIQRVGDNSKFFGFGICQRLNMKIVDLDNSNAPLSGTTIKTRLGIVLPTGNTEFINFPTFTITERNRQEDEGLLSIVAYDKLNEAVNFKYADLDITPPYTINNLISKIAEVLGLGINFVNIPEDDFAFNLIYTEGGNFDGTENLREVLNSISEATQTIYFINENDSLTFKRLDISGVPVASITENDYFTFNFKDNRRLSSLWHVTELGDNVSISSEITGTTQYIRNNPFWERQIDIIDEVLENAFNNVKEMTIGQFDCSWRGNLPLEIGDKIEINQLKSTGSIKTAYVFDDVITFDGGYAQKTQWVYNDNEAETESNPTSIGEVLNKTFAKVDKINKEISLVSSQVSNAQEDIASLKVFNNGISGTVETLKKNVEDNTNVTNNELVDIRNKVNAAITSEDLTIKVQEEIANGVNKVTTATGFTFNESGLTVEKDGSEMKTTIDEDGMTVYKNGNAVLNADSSGVDAHNLHADNYLIIASYSRFQDYTNKNGEARTGCFWLG